MPVGFKKLANAFRTFRRRSLLVNAYVHMVDGRVQSKNWGDDINFHFLKLLTKREIEIYFSTPVAMALRMTNYLCIGSTLNYLTTRRSVVWGAGVIDSGLELRERPARVHAVRGPLTRAYLTSRGIPCPEVYGDPGLLLPYFYRPARGTCERPRRIGIVPHYADWGAPVMGGIKTRHPEVAFIDVANYGGWTDFIDRICACDAILSSSLHGIIVAEAYGIPNYWVSVSDNVLGSGFKFRDFYASIGKTVAAPIPLRRDSDPYRIVSSHRWTQGRLDLSLLLDACPFEIKEAIHHDHPMDLPLGN